MIEISNNRITIKNIADELGISVATVHRALHNRTRISAEMRAKVLDKVAEMGYRPNSIARTLSKNTTTRIDILLPAAADFWEQMREGIRDSVAEWSDFNVEAVFCEDFRENDIANQLGILSRLSRESTDGILVAPFSSHIFRKPIKRLADDGVTVVTINRDCPNSGRLCYVGEDAYGMGYTIGTAYTRFLCEGDTVAALSSDTQEEQIKRRTEGFVDAIRDCKMNLTILEFTHGDSKNSVYDTVASAFKECPGIRAVFANTAQGAYWVAEAKRELKLLFLLSGIDISAESLDFIDRRLMDFTISQDPYSQGFNAVHLLLNHLFKSETPHKEQFFTNVDIILDRRHYLMNRKKQYAWSDGL